MPDLSPEQFGALRADIAAHGIRVPVVVDQHGRVLDGNNRVTIAAELGIDYPVTEVEVADDDEAHDIAASLNCARRHLTQEQKRDLIRAELRRRWDDSDRAVSRRLGCSPTTVGTIRAELRQEAEERPAQVVLDAPSLAELDPMLGTIHAAFVAGMEHGRREREAELTGDIAQRWLHAQAAAVVTRMARLPEADQQASRARAERSSAWWAARRGEVR